MESEQTDRLIAALQAQTKAMQELAESNRAVVDMVLAQQAEEEDDAPTAYLDGETMD